MENLPVQTIYNGTELIKSYADEEMTDILHEYMRNWYLARHMDNIVNHNPTKKGNLKHCSNYRTISLIRLANKVMLKIIKNRLQPQADRVISEEQAGFVKDRSTIGQIFKLRILCEKHKLQQKKLYHIFIDFRKAFDR